MTATTQERPVITAPLPGDEDTYQGTHRKPTARRGPGMPARRPRVSQVHALPSDTWPGKP